MHLGEIYLQFTVFILSEIKNLIYEATENLYILIGNLYQGAVLRCEVICGFELFHRFGDEGERCP